MSFELLIQCIPLYSTLVKEFLKINFKYFPLDIVAIHDLSLQAVPYVYTLVIHHKIFGPCKMKVNVNTPTV